jgi:NAD(P)H-flavin reductase
VASPRSILRIASDERIGPSTRALDVVRTDLAPWTNVRGKYVILDTGLVLPDGKAVKRAYSLTPLSTGDEAPATHCRLIVKRLAGPGSGALHEAPIGAEFSFSGPWGKLASDEDAHERTLFVATDTGITSALGMASVAAGGKSGPLTVLWLRAPDESFFDLERARATLLAFGARFVSATIPPIGTPDRAERAWAHVDACVAEVAPSILLAAGDGDIVFPLKARAYRPSTVRDVRIECFFHNPERKSA